MGAENQMSGYRILLINWRDIAHPEAGGAEVHAHEIFRRLAAAGNEVTFLTCAWPGCESEVEIDGIRSIRGGKNMTFNYAVPGLMKKLDVDRNFDIVIEDVNKIPFNTPKHTSLPRLILFHHLFGSTIFREASFPIAFYVWLWERMIPRFYRNEWVQVVSRDTRSELLELGFDAEKIQVVYNGIDSAQYSPPDDGAGRSAAEEPYILYMGRIKRYKRLELILEAFERAARFGLGNRTKLIFAGLGDDYKRLEKKASELGISHRVSFLGRVSEEQKTDLLRYALCVVNPSPKEGWGITNMEAAACGAPVVASRSPGLRESVRDGKTGYLFTPGDVAQFSARVVQIASDQALRERMSAAAREFALSVTWEEAARLTGEYIGKIVRQAPKRS
jgi:glycosyltransferase involved in cell wall biosynthesis